MLRFLAYSSLGWQVQLALAQKPQVVQNDILHFPNEQVGAFITLMELALGNPPQNITAIFDTGSSDLVVPQTGSPICKSPQQQCKGSKFVAGSFNPETSSDVKALAVPFNASFANGVSFLGSFITTSVTMGGSQVKDTQLGLFSDGNLPDGQPLFPIFGVGPIQGESVPPPNYQNLPAHMKDLGVIKSNVMGLYLNDFRSAKGSVVFGGIDAAKFSGSLQEAPLVRTNDGFLPSFVVDFSSLRLAPGRNTPFTTNTGNSTKLGSRRTHNPQLMPANKTILSPNRTVNLAPKGGLPVSLIDSGNPGVSIPAASLVKLAKVLGTSFDQQRGVLGPIDCAIATKGLSLVFGFNNDAALINVPIELMLVPQSLAGPGVCQLALDSSSDIASLGAPFLQAAYTVFDMDNQRLLFAQAILNSTESRLEEFPLGNMTTYGHGAGSLRVKSVGSVGSARTYAHSTLGRRRMHVVKG